MPSGRRQRSMAVVTLIRQGHHRGSCWYVAYYMTTPLRRTISNLLDLDYLNARHVRLSLGAVKVCSGEMRYFDSRDEVLRIDHILASGALPPAFPAVCIDGEFYWDGGIYSNTPIEAVMDDAPRRMLEAAP